MAKRKKKLSHKGMKFFMTGTALAAAASAYYFYGPKGRQHRKKIRGWSLKAKGEVLERVEQIKNIDKKQYAALVDQMAAKYKKLKSTNAKEVERLAQDLKRQWAAIEKDMAPKVKRSVSKVRKSVRKAVKVSKKTPRKSPKKATRKSTTKREARKRK